MSWDEARDRKLVEAIRSWCCQHRWDVFWTQTFRKPVSCAGAMVIFSRCLADSACSWGVTAALAVLEPHQVRSWHVHALVSVSAPKLLTEGAPVWNTRSKRFQAASTRLSPALRTWKEHFGATVGWCRVYPIRRSAAMTVWYVTKYLTKHQPEAFPTSPDSWRLVELSDRLIVWTDGRSPGTIPWNGGVVE